MVEKKKKTRNVRLLVLRVGVGGLLVLLLSFFIVSPELVTAASLSLSPKAAEYKVGASFKLSIYASSPDQALNTVAGSLTFPPSLLEVTSLSKEGSVFALWIREPSYSNTAGNVTFESVVLNPGYIGNGGKVLTVNFKVKAAGTAALGISGASVLANDGLGTNILKGVSGASLRLLAADAAPPVTPPDPNAGSKIEPPALPADAKAPGLITITSSTHGDSNAWYENTTARFNWTLPADITGVSYVMNDSPTFDPEPVSMGLLTSAAIDNLSDGVHYFHLRLSNKVGWGLTSHYRFQVDTSPPTSKVTLAAPVFINYPTSLKVGDLLKVSGNSYPNTKVQFFVQDPEGVVSDDYTKTDEQGDFAMVWPKGLASGAYRFWALTQATDGAKSPETDRFTVEVVASELALGTIYGINIYVILLGLGGVILLLILVVIYLGRHYHQTSRSKKIATVSPSMPVNDKVAKQLLQHMKEELTTLERAKAQRPLTKEEEQVLAQLIKDLASE